MKYSTSKEIEHAMKRELIARRLADGQTYLQIMNDLGVSSRTISRVSKQMKENKDR